MLAVCASQYVATLELLANEALLGGHKPCRHRGQCGHCFLNNQSTRGVDSRAQVECVIRINLLDVAC